MRGFVQVKALILLATALCGSAWSQPGPKLNHELAPFLGFYAPDRFETSLGYGVRYYYAIDERYEIGATLGFAKARQEYFNRLNSFAIDAGSDAVFYHGARLTRSFRLGQVSPYLIGHLGLTRLRDENDLTYGFGIGTKVIQNGSLSLRYEFMAYIFGSGRDLNAWTNKNVEIVVAVGYML